MNKRIKSYIVVLFMVLSLVCLQAATFYFGGLSGGGPLTVTITGTPTSGPITLAAAFTSTPTGGTTPYTYDWNWGDGTAHGATQNPSHNFTVAGTYTTTLTVTDSASHTASQVKTVLATGATYYVAKSGFDTNNGTSPNTPFLTLTKCQTAMQSGLKVCTVNDSGTYTLAANLSFTSTDNGELWVPGFGQTPVIDGVSSFGISAQGITTTWEMDGFTLNNMKFATSNCIVLGGTGITFRWNTLNTPCSGITISATFAGNGLTNGLIDSDTVNSQVGTGFDAILAGTGSGTTYSHNLINGAQGFGIAFSSSTAVSNTIFDRNIVKNTCSTTTDCGALYMDDFLGTGTGNKITNNDIFGVSLVAVQITKGIYLDSSTSTASGTSNTLISGNVINAAGTFPIFLHCGNHNTVTNNVLDVSSVSTSSLSSMMGYQDQGGCSTGGVMNNNAFNHNIVYDSGAWTNLNAGLYWISGQGGADTNPVSTTNQYWSPTGNAPNPSSGVTDANPFNGNPLFVNPSANNYALMGGSPAFSNISFPVLPTNQGPVNLPFQTAGSTF